MRTLRLVVSVVLLYATGAAAQEPAKFYDDNCSPCHAIGGPPGGAPDLKDLSRRRDHAWLVKFILDPEAMARTDAAAAALVKQYDGVVMPAADGLTPQLVEGLLRHIAGATTPPPAPAAAARAASAEDVEAGHEWYDGRRPLSAGGPACVSCHRTPSVGRFGGGALGPDLTQAHRRLGGTAAVVKWLGNPPTRVMRGIFRTHPLSGEEAFAMSAFLADESSHEGTGARSGLFVVSGAAAALAAMAAMAAVWSRRLRSVRRRVVAAARKDEA